MQFLGLMKNSVLEKVWLYLWSFKRVVEIFPDTTLFFILEI